MRTVLFGIDGLTFRILHPLIERGDLPNFRRLAQEGCEAILESKYPPLTPPAWVSLSTGMKPATHGIYDYWEYESDPQHDDTPSARLLTQRQGGKAIWNILSEYGKNVLVINVPVTYPPEPVNGIMISGYLTPGEHVEYTYPPALKKEMSELVPDYQIDIQIREAFTAKSQEEERQIIDEVLRVTRARLKLTLHLMQEKPWDFCYVVFVGADRLQHTLWEHISGLNEEATEYFRLMDEGLGRIMEQLGPDDNLFVVSDHGFQGARRLFHINEFLYSKKLLALDPIFEQKRAGSRHINMVKHAMRKLGLLSLARKGKQLLKATGLLKGTSFAEEHVMEDLHRPLAHLDLKHTLAHVPSRSTFGGGYADIFLSHDLDEARLAQLCADLRAQVDPVTGTPLVSELFTTEVYGEGPFAPPVPHLLLLPGEGVTISLKFGNEQFWDDANMENDPRQRCGVHQKDGVLYAYGKGLKSGFKAPNAEIFDIVPTVLHSMALPLPHKFDGRVLEELFVREACPQSDAPAEGLTQRKLKKLLALQ
jgi:predicted AlkP superfamily phosphohydrolase/phosphomutase